jgi:hypothetical protein
MPSSFQLVLFTRCTLERGIIDSLGIACHAARFARRARHTGARITRSEPAIAQT